MARNPIATRAAARLPDLATLGRALAQASDAAEVRQIESDLEKAESLMRTSGLYEVEEIRPVNELRMRARWKLGQVLAELERGHGPGRGKKAATGSPSFLGVISKLNLVKRTAQEAQRIGALPEAELEKAFANAHK